MRISEIEKKYWQLAHSASDLGSFTPTDYACRCDICGDSATSRSKRRLHLYIKTGFDSASIHCWNCDYTGNMYSYLREYHPTLFSQYKNENQSQGFNRLVVEVQEKKASSKPLVIENFMEGTDAATPAAIPEAPKPQKLVQGIPLPKISDFPDAVAYLNNRGIEPKNDWLYSTGTLVFDGRTFNLTDYIVIPLTWDNGLWYGFQALAYKKKDFRVVLLPENIGWKVWGWASIKKDAPVYIFESIFDAISSGYDNVLAQMGAQLGVDRLKELKTPIFCLDNQNIDATAKTESLKYLREGYKVFLWPKGSEKFKDANDLRKIRVPYNRIQNMIDNNIFQGMEGVLKIKMEY